MHFSPGIVYHVREGDMAGKQGAGISPKAVGGRGLPQGWPLGSWHRETSETLYQRGGRGPGSPLLGYREVRGKERPLNQAEVQGPDPEGGRIPPAQLNTQPRDSVNSQLLIKRPQTPSFPALSANMTNSYWFPWDSSVF